MAASGSAPAPTLSKTIKTTRLINKKTTIFDQTGGQAAGGLPSKLGLPLPVLVALILPKVFKLTKNNYFLKQIIFELSLNKQEKILSLT